ncbi:23S rRNA (pseudouridine(1915)-N(3))-methyltransferase RlmH [Methylophaga sp.]|jgi:23S rRNA (pseudouridine1915-N3)-methyltransferase|uniref:23S rRNA (pseudouridine(1915)-N(3))-methyltransferase RlmH n=1 Tax=Methylophaga sp. TaxID=2024840 RepID=UPI0013FE67F0|nr:23S rRNA (pseudouridine(1915)-N(3))-methyltransferase RlmH [Methylophaga sp.]MTI62609.1 23S rRNA (pseudouridine(1915)-N(3))-methyltransferase RlmH [Methylophaga sp.]
MKINLVAVGTKMPGWVTQGFEEYSRRLPRECQLQLLEIAPAKRGKTAQPEQWKKEEAGRILAAIPDSHHVIALEVDGKSWDTVTLSAQMQSWLTDGRDVSLMVGGPDGLDASCLQRADQKWSLSPLTLPHPLVRIVLSEQLYRAWTILQNHPYHRA